MKEVLRRSLVRLVTLLLHAQSRPHPFAAGPVLVVAPHADDETLGCGGLIAAKVRRGEPVQVLFLTDSSAGTAQASAAEKAARRRSEALAALGELGLPAAGVHFLDAPDGRLDRLDFRETRHWEGKIVALLRALRPAEIFLPYLGGGSTEHDAAVWLVRDAVAEAGRERPVIWEYPVWAWWNPLRLWRQVGRPGENFHFALGRLRMVKRAALARHESQILPAGAPALPPALAAACAGPLEFYFHRPP